MAGDRESLAKIADITAQVTAAVNLTSVEYSSIFPWRYSLNAPIQIKELQTEAEKLGEQGEVEKAEEVMKKIQGLVSVSST